MCILFSLNLHVSVYISIYLYQVGLSLSGGQRSEEEEEYISLLSGPTRSLLIADARPKVNAMAQFVNKGGFENPEHYIRGTICHASIEFLDLPNIHTGRKVYKTMAQIATKCVELGHPPADFLTQVHLSGHFTLISTILSAAQFIATTLHAGTSVLVHCTDGWDRTPQLTSLAQLLIDPFYRTLPGFLLLIEKEWVSFGHNFAVRLGLGSAGGGVENEQSPTFLHFLDCVRQIMHQHPNDFEFTHELLLFIIDSAETGLYGTFKYDSEKERRQNRIHDKEESLWTVIHRHRQYFLNPLYHVLNSLSSNYELNDKNMSTNLSQRTHCINCTGTGVTEHIAAAEGVYGDSIIQCYDSLDAISTPFRHHSSQSLSPLFVDVSKVEIWSEYYLRYVLFILVM